MKKVLILEDEVSIRSFVVINLNRAGYEVIEAGTGMEALEKLKEHPDVGVAILDIMLPDIDGFEVCRNIRATDKKIGIIMLTARSQEMDKVTGLMTGADDYMTKPFSPAELLAHLRALTRRQGEVVFETLAAGDLSLNLESFDLACGAKSIHLSFKEFSLARVLMANPGQVVSKDLLIEKVWGIESSAEDNNVEAYVSFLRKKLAFLGSSCRIETLRKAGYRFAVNSTDAGGASGGPSASSTSEHARGNAATGDTAGVPDVAAETRPTEDARGSAPC